ncbi:hypothetical protein ABMA28_000458 [Loxostege sticticalis]|uniref:CHASE domain-containing protein n=1 Tax=Loxostege sticticalis TaxID=481309 RepID=A0ABD0TSA9_LOXSC
MERVKITDRPEYLVFTAPYRLCKGGCPKDRNFVLSFPLYVGTRGRAAYQSTYHRDATKVHSNRPNAPFRKRTTRAPTTPCPTERPTTEEKEDPALIQLLYKEKECKNYTGLLHYFNTFCEQIIIDLQKTVILMILPILAAGDSPWHPWSQSTSQATVEYSFQRQGNMLVKTPSDTSQCQCPPNKDHSIKHGQLSWKYNVLPPHNCP